VPITLSAHDLRRVAVEAEVDPRTVKKVVAGGAVRDVLLRRIERAMKKLGVVPVEVEEMSEADDARLRRAIGSFASYVDGQEKESDPNAQP
jgi:DNA-binding LacI/PurR family transcriptional regulator